MKKYSSLVFLVIMLAVFTFNSENVAAKASWPAGPSGVSAEGAVVIDMKSGMVLYEKNMHEELYPASITKIMTTLVALENSSLDEVIKYDASAVLGLEQGSSNAGIQVGEKLTMEQSLYCVMLPSANEACNGVAQHIAGSIQNFAKMMNEKAKKIGCKNTHFANPNGLWMKNHYTSPYDMALIMREAMKNETFRTIAGTTRYDIPKTNKTKEIRYLAGHHQMIYPINQPQYGYDYAIAGKTGYTSKSQATLVTAAKKGDMELICVVMKARSGVQGEPNIYTDTIKLFNYCFEKFSQHSIDDGTASELADAFMFTKFSPFFDTGNATLSLEGNGSVILPKKVSLDKTTKKVQYYNEATETSEGKVIGRVSYYYDGKEAGGANILYRKSETSTILSDSIDMTEWLQEAVEEASTPAFPWRNLLILVAISAGVAAVAAFIIMKIKEYKKKAKVRKHYKRNRNEHLPDYLKRRKK